MAWAEGALWVGQHRSRKIHQVDPQTGAILRTIESNRFVTGVTWVGGELWHGTWEDDESDAAADRSEDGRSARAARHARRASRCRVLNRMAATRFLRRRQQRESESRPPAHAKLRGQAEELRMGVPERCEQERSRMSAPGDVDEGSVGQRTMPAGPRTVCSAADAPLQRSELAKSARSCLPRIVIRTCRARPYLAIGTTVGVSSYENINYRDR